VNNDSARVATLRRASAIFIFLALSGLIPWLARYGVISQWILLLHIIVGLAAIVPLAVIFIKHGGAADRDKPARWWSAGLWSGIGWAALGLSGLWLVGKGMWGVFVPYRMHSMHLVAGIAFGIAGLIHIVYGLARNKFPRDRYAQLARPLAMCLLTFAVGAAAIGIIRRHGTLAIANFVPSNARTDTGRVIPAKLLLGSESCGASSCHSTIYEEWVPSAHHFSGTDPFYAVIKANYIKAQGVGAGKYCAGCHEPISLISGENIHAQASPASQAGSSCVFCHVLRHPDVKGNANYVATAPNPYLFEFSSSPALRKVSQALIRLHPEQHKLDYDARHAQPIEFCGTCHKQYLDKRVNGWGFVQLQNQYDDLKNGPWYTNEDKRLSCQSCHMREVTAEDPARNAKGVIHEHRILASNTFVPEMLHLPGAGQQIELVKQWLTGQTVIPEIAKVWPAGPIIALELTPESSLAEDQMADIRALAINTKVGHAFPTGPLDVIQSWLEFTATDAKGQPVFSAGTLDGQERLQGKTVEYRSFLLDRQAHVLYNHALWDAVGARDKRMILPGASDSAEFQFHVPRGVAGPLHCKLRLLYRKFNPDSLTAIFPNTTPPPVPITEISSFSVDLPVQAAVQPAVRSAKRAAVPRQPQRDLSARRLPTSPVLGTAR
jgi:hypothetical protein